MRDIFLLMKRNADPQDTETYWCGFSDQVAAILTKYNGHDMAVDFCVTACQYYEKQVKAIREGVIS